MTAADLAPCPFCGTKSEGEYPHHEGPQLKDLSESGHSFGVFVQCATCFAEGPRVEYLSDCSPEITEDFRGFPKVSWEDGEALVTNQWNTLSRRAALFPEALELLRSESRIWDGDRMLCGCCREPLPERTSSLGGSIPGDCVTPDCDVSRLLKRAAEITPEVQR